MTDGIFTNIPIAPCSAAAAVASPRARLAAGRASNGILVIDKPEGPTSFTVVKRIKRRFGLGRAGHCGTLDPFATGVLLICFNQATRIADQLLDHDKAYRFTLRLGIETDTLDKTGQVVGSYDGPPSSEEDLRTALKSFVGSCVQKTPRYSAVKIEGKRLYKLARKGIEVDPPKREICIRNMDLLSYRWPEASLEVRCSKGTYVRQLASDIGSMLGCGAHVSELRRIASGPFRAEDAIPFRDIEDASDASVLDGKLVSMSDALSHLPSIMIEDQSLLKCVFDGQLDRDWEDAHRERFPECKTPVRLVDVDNRLVALWWPHPEAQGRRLRVFQPSSSAI